jgi:ABC-2 type transport system permease protein
MRAVMFEHVVRSDLMWQAAGLNVVYLAAGAGAFLFAFNSARQRGLLLNVGE